MTILLLTKILIVTKKLKSILLHLLPIFKNREANGLSLYFDSIIFRAILYQNPLVLLIILIALHCFRVCIKSGLLKNQY